MMVDCRVPLGLSQGKVFDMHIKQVCAFFAGALFIIRGDWNYKQILKPKQWN